VSLILFQDIVTTHISQYDEIIPSMVPYNSYIHVYAAFKKFVGSLYAFCSQGRMNGILSQKLKFTPELFLLPCGKLLIALLESV